MAITFKWPWLGVAIPCGLISILAYGSHWFILRHHMSGDEQIRFQIYVTIIWLTYVIAIYVTPGSPPPNFKPQVGEWRRWCQKCQNHKPPRTHHCRSCKTCVLKMDHHCPWTNNCVGHANLAHFLRFLISVVFTTTILFIHLCERVGQYYQDRNLPSYLINKSEMMAVLFLLPIDFFVLSTVSILLGRCLWNLILRGMTQIEVWERERLESQFYSERMWGQIRKNYLKLHKKPMPELQSWNRDSRYYEELAQREDELQDAEESGESIPLQTEEERQDEEDASLVPKDFTMDDFVFPYDLGVWQNLVVTCGYPWMWLMPWGGPRDNGVDPVKSEYVDEDQLGLPWPPDGGHQELTVDSLNNTTNVDELLTDDVRSHDLSTLRRRMDPRLNMTRTEWMNDLGETLDDFGVDVEAEAFEKDDLMSNDSNDGR